MRKPSLWMALLPLLYMVAEVGVFIWVAQSIGWWILLVILSTTALGMVLVRRETAKALGAAREAMREGVLPQGMTGSRIATAIGAILLIQPGLIGNVLGLLLVTPFTRPLITKPVGRLAGRTRPAASRNHQVIRGDVVDDDVHEGTLLPPLDPPRRQALPDD